MFQIKNNIAAGVALVVFLTSLAAFAEGDSSVDATKADTAKSTQKKPTKKKPTKKKLSKAAPESIASKSDTVTPPSDASAPSKSDVAAAPQSTPSTPSSSNNPPTPAATEVPPVAVTKVNAPVPPNAKVDDTDSAEAIKQRSGSGDPVAGKDKSELCQGCHGEEGISAESTAPKLAGQYAGYIIKQIRDFRSGLRVHQIMSDVAKTVNEDDLPDIAAYFASRKKMKGNGSDNKVGQELFLHGDMSRMMVACVNCHGVNGKGKTPTNPVFPVLGGQHKDYLRVQLTNFRSGDRGNSPGGVMNIITQKLTDAELDALANYVSGL